MSSDIAVITAVTEMVEAVNRGDMGAAIAAFSESPLIIEDIPPFRWDGADAVSGWLSAMGANAARLKISAIAMSIGEPSRIEVEEGRAYALFPGRLSMTGGGADMTADGLLTFTLRAEDCWVIDSLIWSGAQPAPA